MIREAESIKNNSLVKGTLSLTISIVVVKIIGFLYKIPLASILKDEGMGYFNSAYTVFTFFYMLCCGGIPKAISIIITEKDTEKKGGESDGILAVCLKIFLLTGIFFSLMLAIFSPFIASMIGNKYAYFSLLAIAPSLIFVSLTGVLRGYLNGKRRISSIAISEILDGCIKFIVGLVFAIWSASRGYRAEIVSAFAIFGIVVSSFITTSFLYIASKIHKTEYITRQKFKYDIDIAFTLKRILKTALPITLSTAVMSASNLIDLGMIVRRLAASGTDPVRAIALYGNFTTLALPMLNLVGALISPIATSALPEFTALKTVGKYAELSKLCSGIIKACTWFAVPIAFAFLLFSGEILCIFFDDTSASLAAPLLTLLSPCAVFLPILTVSNTALEASGHSDVSLFSMTAGIIVKITLNYLLISNPDIGILGAPIGTTVCYCCALIISMLYISTFLKLRISVFPSLIKPTVFSALSIGIGRTVYDKICNGAFSFFAFFSCAIICVAIYLLLNFIFLRREFQRTIEYIKTNKKSVA